MNPSGTLFFLEITSKKREQKTEQAASFVSHRLGHYIGKCSSNTFSFIATQSNRNRKFLGCLYSHFNIRSSYQSYTLKHTHATWSYKENKVVSQNVGREKKGHLPHSDPTTTKKAK